MGRVRHFALRRFVASWAAVMALWALPAAPAAAADRAWDEPAGGLFHEGSNWSGGMAPGPADVAVFNLSAAAPYAVRFGADASVRGIDLANDNVLFDLAGHTLNSAAKTPASTRIGYDAAHRATARFTGGGTLVTPSPTLLAGPEGSTAAVTLDGPGTLWQLGNLDVGDAGSASLTVSRGAALSTGITYVGALPSSRSEVTVTGPGSRWDAARDVTLGSRPTAPLGGNASLSVLDGGEMAFASFLFAGIRQGSSARVTVSGVSGSTRSTLRGPNFAVDTQSTLLVQNGALVDVSWVPVGYTIGDRGGEVVVGGEAGGFKAELVTENIRVGGGPAGREASLTVDAGGAARVTHAAVVGDQGRPGRTYVRGGELTAGGGVHVNDGALELTAGTVASPTVVASPARSGRTGVFTQTGGVVTGWTDADNRYRPLTVRVGGGQYAGGTYNLHGGTIRGGVNNATNGVFNHTGGTIDIHQLLDGVTNQGTYVIGPPPVGAAPGGEPRVVGTFTNGPGGTVRVDDASARFDGDFVNNSAFFSDGGRTRFNRFLTRSGSSVRAVGGAELTVARELSIELTSPTRWDTTDARLNFDDAAANFVTTYLMSVHGVDRGEDGDGYDVNFAWGALRVAAGDFLTLRPPTAGHALYVGELILEGGVDEVDHLRSPDFETRIYYDERLPANAYLGGRDYRGVGVSIIAIPEPAAGALLCAAAALLVRRRR